MTTITSQRKIRLVGIAAIGGAVLGFSANAATTHPHLLWHIDFVVIGGLLGALIGATVGVITSPLVVFALRRKDLFVAVPACYLIVLLATVVLARRDDPIAAVVPSIVALAGICLLLSLALPNELSRFSEGKCWSCGYDRRGSPSHRCGECGHDATAQQERRDRRRSWVRRFVLVPIIAACLVPFGWCLGQWTTAMRFDPAKMTSIAHGMTVDEVHALLGPPSETWPRPDRWIYSTGNWIAPEDFYEIEFSQGRVVSFDTYAYD